MYEMDRKTKKNNIYYVAVIILLIVFLVAISYFSMSLQNIIEQNTNFFLQETALHQAKLFNAKINDQISVLETVENNFSDIDFDDYNMVKECICATEGLGEFNSISVADKTGFAIRNNNTMAGNISQMDYYKSSMTGKSAVSDGLVVNEENETNLIISVPVYKGSEVKGVLMGSFADEQLTDLFNLEIFGGSGYAYVIDSDGNVIIAGPSGALLMHESNMLDFLKRTNNGETSSYGRFVKDLKNGMSGIMEYTVDNRERHAAYEPVGIYDWYVVSVITDDVILNQSKSIGEMVIILILCIVMLFISIIVIIVRIMSKKVSKDEITDANNKFVSNIQIGTENVDERYDNDDDTDALTGVSNKNNFAYKVTRFFEDEKSDGVKRAAFFIMDMADFSSINDNLGHSYGDYVLERAVIKLQRIFNEKDYIGRVGGDEFAVFMKVDDEFDGEQLKELAALKAEQICSSMQEITYTIGKKTVKLSVTVGISVSPDNGSDYVRMYRHADSALEKAKMSNKGRFLFYE